MAAANKKIVYIGAMNNTAGETLTFPALGIEESYHRMDIIINVKTITGTSMTYSIQEALSDNSGAQLFIETGNSGALTTTGKKAVLHEASTHTGDVGSNGLMGKLMQKQIVSTASAISAITADIYAIFYTEN